MSRRRESLIVMQRRAWAVWRAHSSCIGDGRAAKIGWVSFVSLLYFVLRAGFIRRAGLFYLAHAAPLL